MHARTHTQTRTNTRTHAHARVHTHAHTRQHTHAHTCPQGTHVHVQTCAHTCAHAHSHKQAHTCTHTCTRAFTQTHTQAHTCMHTHMHTHGKPERTRLRSGYGPPPQFLQRVPGHGDSGKELQSRAPLPLRPAPPRLSLCTSHIAARTRTLHTLRHRNGSPDWEASPLSVQWHLWASERESILCRPGFLTCDKRMSFCGTMGCAWICRHRLRFAFQTLH